VNAFSPRILKNASRQLKKLDPPAAKRIVDRITWLEQHFEEIKPEALKGDLADFSNTAKEITASSTSHCIRRKSL